MIAIAMAQSALLRIQQRNASPRQIGEIAIKANQWLEEARATEIASPTKGKRRFLLLHAICQQSNEEAMKPNIRPYGLASIAYANAPVSVGNIIESAA